MAKSKILKPYDGNVSDLVEFGARPISDFWIIKLQGVAYCIGRDEKKNSFHTSEGRAKFALTNHIYANFCQGHYWHKGKNNTFAIEKGWERNNGRVGPSSIEFKDMAKQMTEWLLESNIFTIVKVTL